ncbi:sulfate permease, SulP family [Gammaproteobacteria bacterium]
MRSPHFNQNFSAWIFTVIPALDSLRRYYFHDFRADLIAGLTVATVAVPQAMAYAMVAGLPVEYGLYTAIVMTAVGAVFDSSRQLINGPTNAISIAVFSAVASITVQEDKIQATILFSFMMGFIQLGITMLRLGDLTRYISHSVILGFTVGASGLLVLDQLKNLLGLKVVGSAHDHVLYRFWRTMMEGGSIQPETLLLGLATIFSLILLRWFKNRIGWRLMPELLLVVIASSVLVAWLGLDQRGVKVIGDIPAKLPSFQVPMLNAGLMRDFATGALAVAVLGLLEAISMAKAIAAKSGQKLDLNQQCLSEGVANFAGSFFQCIPGSGSLTRSAINQQAGAVSQWSGVISAVAVALIVLYFAPYAHYIPRAALAGILIVSSYHMVDRQALLRYYRTTHYDATIILVTAIAAIAVSIEFCVLIGVFMSFVLAVPRAGRMLFTEFVVTAEGGIHERLPEDTICNRILIFGLEGELFFGATTALETHFSYMEGRIDEHTRVLVLRMKRVRNPDAVGIELLENFLKRLKRRNIKVILCGVRINLHHSMQRSGLLERLEGIPIFQEQLVRQTSTLLAVRHAYSLVDDHCPNCACQSLPSGEQSLYFMV